MTLAEVLAAAAALTPEERRRLVAAIQALETPRRPVVPPVELDDVEDGPALSPYGATW